MLERVGRFVTPDRSASIWVRLAPYAVLVAAGLVLFVLVGAGWEYTNSSAFCGTACHTMPPEYVAYQSSPHARVKCVDCHIGRAYIATQFARKVQDVSHVVSLIGADYEVPIYAKKLRPAAQICERCHFAEKFSDTSLREYKHYDADRNNELTVSYLALKTGGGSFREGRGTGIHWHIENQVEYIATDRPELRQEIPWVRVTYAASGESLVYTDVTADLAPDFAEQNRDRIRTLDCMDCHNRISHRIRTPADALDDALARGVIPSEIPYIKQNAVAVMERSYPSMEEARKAIYGLVEYYQRNWPDYYAANARPVFDATRKLAELYEGMVFPTMDVSWETHPNNDGHRDWPGCFRCHDGGHLDGQNQAIPINCTTCHSIPVQSRPDGTIPDLAVEERFAPESHADSNWLAQHRFEFDATCDGCHTVANPGGLDNSSFCANSGCHATEWRYAKLDAPAILEITNVLDDALPQLPGADLTWNGLVGPLLAARCVVCHDGASEIGGSLNLTSYAGAVAGAVIAPGDGANSPLVDVQRRGHPNRLPERQLQWLVRWIDAGAPR